MHFRNYDPSRDSDAVHRIWLEVGWIEPGKEEAMDLHISAGRAMVAEINGTAECLVVSALGTVRYLREDLPLSCITGVTTSRLARKQGLAGRLTAQVIAADAAEGALVSALSMFEQGYYNQLGYGTGCYERHHRFDPSSLKINTKPPIPQRITKDDWERAHAARLSRKRRHGNCNLTSPSITHADMLWVKNGFGLGYADDTGAFTHLLWCAADDVGSGPYTVCWLVYHTPDQFLELMALLRNLGDQVMLVKMTEPEDIQLQDLLEQPFKHRQVTEKTKYANEVHAAAYWQMRICDLPGCLAQTRLPCADLRFNLELTDPIERFLGPDAPWRGISGRYVVTLGPSCGAGQGADPSLPTLAAGVGAFTRLWLGAVPATGLAVTDTLSGPQELLETLDETFRLPKPQTAWDF
ncbi:MAG: GNAT family N-acetyltransferase [Armatimonadota bacterium]